MEIVQICLFVFRKGLGYDLEVLESLGFMSKLWVNFSLNFHHFIALENKPILHGFQVQNVIFLVCLTRHALEFCTKSYDLMCRE
jgi:hypothetical protein